MERTLNCVLRMRLVSTAGRRGSRRVFFYLTEPNFPADRVFWMCVRHGALPIIGGAYAAFHPYIVEHEKLVEVARAKLYGMEAL